MSESVWQVNILPGTSVHPTGPSADCLQGKVVIRSGGSCSRPAPSLS